MVRRRLPVISGRAAVQAFERDGWTLVRQTGSHMIMTKASIAAVLSIPNYRELKRGTLRGIIRKARLEVAEFIWLLGS